MAVAAGVTAGVTAGGILAHTPPTRWQMASLDTSALTVKPPDNNIGKGYNHAYDGLWKKTLPSIVKLVKSTSKACYADMPELIPDVNTAGLYVIKHYTPQQYEDACKRFEADMRALDVFKSGSANKIKELIQSTPSAMHSDMADRWTILLQIIMRGVEEDDGDMLGLLDWFCTTYPAEAKFLALKSHPTQGTAYDMLDRYNKQFPDSTRCKAMMALLPKPKKRAALADEDAPTAPPMPKRMKSMAFSPTHPGVVPAVVAVGHPSGGSK